MAESERVKPVEIRIDKRPVQLFCTRLTVNQYNELIRFGVGGRGTNPLPESGERVVQRVQLIDRYVRVHKGDVLDEEDRPIERGLAAQMVSQSSTIELLYSTLVQAQQLSAEERQSLIVAARFSGYLEQEYQKKPQERSPWAVTGTDCRKCHQLKLCGKRMCHGKSSRRVVWRDKQLVLRTCPVLHFTPDVEEALRLFFWTYELRVQSGHLRWTQAHFVNAGGLGDQDAWLTSAFNLLCLIHMRMLKETSKANG